MGKVVEDSEEMEEVVVEGVVEDAVEGISFERIKNYKIGEDFLFSIFISPPYYSLSWILN